MILELFPSLADLTSGHLIQIHSYENPDESRTLYWESNPRLKIDEMSICISREMAPIYTMGPNPDPRAFARQRHSIAGTIRFIGEQPEGEIINNECNDIPPTDITVQFRKDSSVAEMKILGIELLRQTIFFEPLYHIDDLRPPIYDYTYIARAMIPWKMVDSYKEEEDTIYAD